MDFYSMSSHSGPCRVLHGALMLVAPAKQRLSTVWMRKETGKEYRIGMKNPLSPNMTPPSGSR